MARPVPSLAREAGAWAAARLLIGVDEVGRGPLAGPVVAAAVVFPPDTPLIEGLRDSKTLSERQRLALVPRIRAAAAAVGLAGASVREIDRLNIRVATALAMRRAVARVLPRCPAAEILLDGLPMPELGHPHDALVDGDAHCMSIAAAGVLAKCVRDALMARLAARHPGFGWERNMGYGTAEHLAALRARGPSPHHRRGFAPVAQLGLAFGA